MSSSGEPRTIGSIIQRLARQTGASPAFVEQVRGFFEQKRIPLDANADPYLAALQEAFLLEESVRRNTAKARENLVRLQDCLRLVGATYQHQLAQLKRVRDSLEQQNRLVREGALRLRDLSRAIAQGRTTVSAPKGAPTMVPGPTDIQ